MDQQQAQRESEFGELYRSHLSAIGKYAARRTSPANAVDVVAETFTIAWRRFNDMPSGTSTRPWLYGVARRVLANQRRGDLRRSALHKRLASEWIVHQDPVDERPDLELLRQALESLSESDREIVMLAGVEELKPAEIAIVLDVLPEVARNRLSRARSRLRAAMDQPAIRSDEFGHVIGETDYTGGSK